MKSVDAYIFCFQTNLPHLKKKHFSLERIVNINVSLLKSVKQRTLKLKPFLVFYQAAAHQYAKP